MPYGACRSCGLFEAPAGLLRSSNALQLGALATSSKCPTSVHLHLAGYFLALIIWLSSFTFVSDLRHLSWRVQFFVVDSLSGDRRLYLDQDLKQKNKCGNGHQSPNACVLFLSSKHKHARGFCRKQRRSNRAKPGFAQLFSSKGKTA